MQKSLIHHIQTIRGTPIKIVVQLKDHSFIVLKYIFDADYKNLQILRQLVILKISFKTMINGQNIILNQPQIQISSQSTQKPYLLIKSKYFVRQNLHVQNSQQLSYILSSLINLMIKTNNNYFCSFQNIFYDKNTGQISFNLTSNCGLMFILHKKFIQKQKLAEIYELLGPQMFQRKNQEKPFIMDLKPKFRSLCMIVLFYIFGNRLSFLPRKQDLQETISFEKANQLFLLFDKRLMQFLSINENVDKIRKISERDNANYLFFLKRVYSDKCKDLTWSQTIDLLFSRPKNQNSSSSIFLQFARQLYNSLSPYSKKIFEQLGLGLQSQLQLFLLVKAGINLQLIIGYSSIQDFLIQKNYQNQTKEQVCKAILRLLDQFANRRQSNQKQLQKVDQEKVQLQKRNIYQRYQEIYKLISQSMGNFTAKIKQSQIKYMTRQKEVLKRYLNL